MSGADDIAIELAPTGERVIAPGADGVFAATMDEPVRLDRLVIPERFAPGFVVTLFVGKRLVATDDPARCYSERATEPAHRLAGAFAGVGSEVRLFVRNDGTSPAPLYAFVMGKRA